MIKKKKGAQYKIIRYYKLTTSPLKKLPDFMIIGAQRCGTTFLYDYITKHPNVDPVWYKEPNFF